MKHKLQKSALFFIAVSILLLSATVARSQEDTTPKKKLRSPATARGVIGGESHDSYVIRARKGQTLTVRISWRPDGDNSAGFTVSRSSNFFTSEPVGAGKESDGGKRWVGKIPRTGNYYIYVTGHPTADYTLRVKVS